MDTYGHPFPEDLEQLAQRKDARIRRVETGRRRDAGDEKGGAGEGLPV